MPNLIPFPIQPKMSNMVPVSNFENGKKHQKKYGQVLVEGEKEKKTNMVPFLKLFKFADSLDYILMAIGTTGAMLHGASFPVFFLIFGKLVNVIGVAAASSSPVSDEVAKVQQRLADVYGKQKTVVDYHKHFVSFEPGDLTMVFRKDDNEREGHQTHDAYALDFLYLSVVVLFSSWMEVSCWMYTGERQSAKMRLSYLRSMLNQDISLFDMKDSTGEIIAAITSDVIVIQDAISEKVGNFIHYVCGSITGFTIGFIKVWQISLVTLSIVPLMVIAGGLHVYVETGLIARVRKSYVKAGTIADEVIGNIRTVQAFVAEEKAVKSYTAALTKSYEYGKKGGLAKGLGLGAIYFFLFTSWALLIWFTSIVVHEGIANGGESFATMAIVVTSGLSLGRAAPNLGVFIKARVAAYSIFDMIESAHNKLKSKNCRSLKKVRGHIEFHNVCFSYPSRSNVTIIDHLNLDIPSGKVVALVGGSGSGKSTVVSLIERFYEPRSGHILLDRNNIRDLDLNWFRQQIGLVNQEPALFSTTIRENILYGKNNATLQEITQAARLSEALSFITNLPDKYDTQVGERGIQLSGGQKQRIAIARAILRNPAILLLDEATSALDAESEKSVQRALDQVMVDRTTVVVAHRLSTIRNADVIAVFNGGRIIETGSHSELLSDPNSAYSGLVEMQQATSSRDHQTVSPNFGPSTRYSSTELSNISSSFGSSIYSERDYVSHNVPYGIEIKLPTKTSSVSMRRLFEIAAPDYLYWVLGVLGAIAVGIQMPLFALGIATTLAAYYKDWDSTQSEIRELALIFCVCAALNVVFNTVEHLSFGIMGERLTLRARAMMFSAILRNEIGWFDETDNNSSILSSRLEADATALKILVVDRFAMLVQNISLAVTSFVIAFIFNWRMTFVILATYPLIILGNISEKLFIQGYGGNLSKTYLKANMLAGEAVINIRTLAGFGAEDKMVSLYSHELIDPKKQAFRRGQIAGIFYGITQFFIFSSYGLALWYGSVLLDKGQANFSSIIKPYFVLMVAAILMAETLAMAPDLMKGNQMVSSLFEIMDRKTKVENDIGEVIGSVEGRIQLNGIKFSYPSRPDVLIFNGFDLKVRIGQSVALVGSSGSGKSSVIALILRYYNPTAGRITIDGKDIKKLNLKSLRKHIGLVQQEPTLFATTIYENILYGRDGASESEVIQAAKLANAHTFVSGLPKGYSTKVGERGIQLSGGQKQRVAIARAILKNPSILLLDEATSSLDVISERTVQQALDRIMKNRTTIVVAHRLSTIKKADQICVLQEGKIIEKGSHSSLIENEAGMYYKLIKHQQQ